MDIKMGPRLRVLLRSAPIPFLLLFAVLFPASTAHPQYVRSSNQMGEVVKLSHHPCIQYIERRTVDCSNEAVLTQVPQELLTDVQILLLMNNKVQRLNNTSFTRYKALTDLDMSVNIISHIEQEAFNPLKYLRHLNLRRNRLVEIPAIDSCGQYDNQSMTMDLSNNLISEITNAAAFLSNCQALTLKLNGNRINKVNADIIASFQIRGLFFGSSPISQVMLSDLISGVSRSNIEELRVENKAIDHFPHGIFDNFRHKPLSLLSLSENIVPIHEKIFGNLSQVTVLELQRVEMFEVRPEYFDGMTQLHTLDLNHNNIFVFNPNCSPWTIDIQVLSLMYSSMTVMNNCTLFGLKSLSILYFSSPSRYVNAVYIPKDWLLDQLLVRDSKTGNVSLNTVHMRMLHLSKSIIDCMKIDSPLMQVIFIIDTKIRCSLRKTLFTHLHGLFQLILNENRYGSDIPIFSNLSNLETLELRKNNIDWLHRDSFQGLVSLRTLDLRENYLTRISPLVIKEFVMLRYFYADSNKLAYLDNDLFRYTTNLTYISLSDNHLVTLNRSTFDPVLSSLHAIDISRNPWVCNCDISWLVTSMNGTFVNDDNTICSSVSPIETLKMKPLTLFHPEEVCRQNTALLILVCAGILGIVFILVVVYTNRWSLRYKMFLLKLAVIGYEEKQDARDREEFEYDINIIFTEADINWTTDVFHPMLDKRLPDFGRIALGDDALMLGMHYLDAVYDVVANSFKTVMILSRAAVKDHNFMNKFRIAVNCVDDTQTKNMVLVFIEKIPDQELPHLVRLYLSGHGAHIYWAEDAMGQEYFWNKFTKHLSINMKVNHPVPVE